MVIDNLKIRNIRKFEEKSCDFKPGLNIVLGDNFAGKTTLCESMFYCLFGESLKGRKNTKALAKYDSLISEVTLSLRREQDNIQITRRLPNELKITAVSQNRSRTIASKKDTDIFLNDLFGQNVNSLKFGFLSESEVVEFITLTKSDRRDLIYSIAGINTLEKIRDIFIENRKQSKREEKSIQMEVDALSSHLNYEIDRIFLEVKSRKDAIQSEYDNLLKQVVSSAGSDNSTGIKADLAELKKDLEEKHSELAIKLSEFNSIESIVEFIRTLDEKEKELAEKTEEFDALDQRVKNGKAFISQLDAHLDELNTIRVDASGPNCPLCTQPLSGDKLSQVISTNLTKKCKADERMGELQSRADKLKGEIERLKKLLAQKPDLLARRDIAQILVQDIEKISENISKKEMQLGLLDGSGTTNKAGTTHQADTGNRSAVAGKDLNSLKAALDKLTNEYEQILVQKTNHDRNAASFIEGQQKLKASEKTRAICEAAVTATEKCMEKVIHDIFTTAGADITAFINDLGVLPAYRVEISVEDYMPVVWDTYRKIDITTLSGSEKSLIYIGLKLAVSVAFQNQLLVLDDPTIYLDPPRQRDFVKSMYRLSQTGKQVILMTSNPALLIDEANVIRI